MFKSFIIGVKLQRTKGGFLKEERLQLNERQVGLRLYKFMFYNKTKWL